MLHVMGMMLSFAAVFCCCCVLLLLLLLLHIPAVMSRKLVNLLAESGEHCPIGCTHAYHTIPAVGMSAAAAAAAAVLLLLLLVYRW